MENPALPPEQIQSLRESKRRVFYERQSIIEADIDDLDLGAVEMLGEKIGDSRDATILLSRVYHLLDSSREPSVLRRAFSEPGA